MIDKQPKKPPMLPSTGGRPGINWPMMFDIWVKSELSKTDFLKQYGIRPNTGSVKRNTKGWTQGAKELRKAALESGKVESKDTAQIDSLYQLVTQWRAGQAKSDYSIADAIKTHIKMILNTRITHSENGTALSTLRPAEIRAIAQALESVQRTQRLALGMSTDNVGVNFPEPDGNVESSEIVDSPNCPVFVVEVNENGKFKRARPRQIA